MFLKTNFKFIFKIFAISCLILTGCGVPDDLSTNNTITGKLTDYSTGTIDTVKCTLNNTLIAGKSVVSSDGNFSIKLSIPSGNKIGKMENVAVSDTNAIVSSFWSTKGYKNGITKGIVYKTNVTGTPASWVGYVVVLFFYTDRDLTLKGTMSVSTPIYSIIHVYDLELNKGWNEVGMKINEETYNSDFSTENITFSSKIPTDLKWKFFAY